MDHKRHAVKQLQQSYAKVICVVYVSSLPAGIDGLVNLEKLNLSHNKLEHLPIALGNLPNLR